MITNPSSIFQYFRGALRGAYGLENFYDKPILIIGIDSGIIQEIVCRLYRLGAKIYLISTEHRMLTYKFAVSLSPDISPYDGQVVDIILDLESKCLTVKDKRHLLEEIGEEPYTQGIHDFYI